MEITTQFFHLYTIKRRKRNKIECLEDADGNLVEDLEKLKGMAGTFFRDLYTEEH